MKFVIEVTVECDRDTARTIRDGVEEYLSDAPAWLEVDPEMTVSLRYDDSEEG